MLYGIASAVAGGTGAVLLATNHEPILGVGFLLFGIAGFGWSCAARDWFFKPKN